VIRVTRSVLPQLGQAGCSFPPTSRIKSRKANMLHLRFLWPRLTSTQCGRLASRHRFRIKEAAVWHRELRFDHLPDQLVFIMQELHHFQRGRAALREKDDNGRTLEQSLVDQYKVTVKKGVEKLSAKYGSRALSTRVRDLLFEQNPGLPPISKQAVEYWLRAAERAEVDTPHAAINPAHVEAFLKLMGAGVLARPLTDAVRIVRSDLRRDGHTNRGLFDRLLLDADSLIQGPQSSFARLQSIRRDAMESIYPVLERHLENASASSAGTAVLARAAE
jgi:hypothetical protein